MSFYNVCKRELGEILQKKGGFESYRASQLFRYIYQNSIQERYIPKPLLQFLSDNYVIGPIGRIGKESISKIDGTRKLLIELDSPKYKVESNEKNE